MDIKKILILTESEVRLALATNHASYLQASSVDIIAKMLLNGKAILPIKLRFIKILVSTKRRATLLIQLMLKLNKFLSSQWKELATYYANLLKIASLEALVNHVLTGSFPNVGRMGKQDVIATFYDLYIGEKLAKENQCEGVYVIGDEWFLLKLYNNPSDQKETNCASA